MPMWSATRRFTLRPPVAGPDVAGALERLLTEWSAHVRADPRAANEDSTAYVFVPSRGPDTFPGLLWPGWCYVVVAARTAPRSVPVAAGVTVRRGRPGDLAALSKPALAQTPLGDEFGSPVDRRRATFAAALDGRLAQLLRDSRVDTLPRVDLTVVRPGDRLAEARDAIPGGTHARWSQHCPATKTAPRPGVVVL